MTECDRLGLRGFRWVVDKVREVVKEEKGEDNQGKVGRSATDDGEGRERRRGQERRAEGTAKARQTNGGDGEGKTDDEERREREGKPENC